jgi:hypothetical protein
MRKARVSTARDRLRGQPKLADKEVDLVVARGDYRYIVELKAASEGRSDRLVPLLSQAILQVRVP